MHGSFADVNHRAFLGLSLMGKREEVERGRERGTERGWKHKKWRIFDINRNSYGRTASTKTPEENSYKNASLNWEERKKNYMRVHVCTCMCIWMCVHACMNIYVKDLGPDHRAGKTAPILGLKQRVKGPDAARALGAGGLDSQTSPAIQLSHLEQVAIPPSPTLRMEPSPDWFESLVTKRCEHVVETSVQTSMGVTTHLFQCQGERLFRLSHCASQVESSLPSQPAFSTERRDVDSFPERQCFFNFSIISKTKTKNLPFVFPNKNKL